MKNIELTEKLLSGIWDIVEPEIHNENLSYTFNQNPKYNELIESEPSIEMILMILKNFSSSTSVIIIFCTSYLWKDLSRKEISNILIDLFNNRKFEGVYSFCVFFHHYLELDLLSEIKLLDIENDLKQSFILDENPKFP